MNDLSLPEELSFYLYSKLRKDGKTNELRILLGNFTKEFDGRSVCPRGDYRKEMDAIFETRSRLVSRDAIICNNNHPISVQQFSISSDRYEAYAEGIFVDEDYRRQGIALILREVLFHQLIKQDIERFYIGQKGPVCVRIRKTALAQRLAEKDIAKHERAVIDLQRTKKTGLVSCYGIDLSCYNFTYDVSRIQL